jgi:type IV pilus assembly protein PilQ
MRHIWKRVTTALVLLGAIAPGARAFEGAGGARPTNAATVTGVSIVPGDRGANVIIRVQGDVAVQDFTLAEPRRLVVDITGATLAAPLRLYDRVSRAGIVNVRMAQYKPDVVRIVLDLDGKPSYEVLRPEAGGDVRLTIDGPGSTFAPWHTGPVSVTEGEAPAPAVAERVSTLDSPAIPVSNVGPRMGPSAAIKPLQPQQVQQQPRITVTYQNADIRDVIAAFATFAGRTIVVGKDVEGSVTAEIRDQPWDVALRAILRAQGLDAREDPGTGIIVVDSYQNVGTRVSTEPLVTQMVRLNYARASSLLPTVMGLLSRDCRATGGGAGAAGGEGGGATTCVTRGNVVSDSGTNALLITDVPSRIDDVMSYINALDIRTPQVALKAKIIFVNRSEIEDLGLRYDLGTGTQQFFSTLVQRIDPSTRRPVDTNGDGVPDALGGGTAFEGNRISLGGNAISAIANANATVANPTLSLVFSTALGRFDLTAFVDALQEVRLADLQAEPSIVTLDNRPAMIFSGQDIPFRTIDAGSATGGGTQQNAPRAVTQIVQAGIRLAVTPHITSNRHVLLTLAAENSDAQLAASDVGFIINRQQANNELLVADGETAVIGGLTVTQVTSSKVGIPLLVDLPVIGRFFGQTRTQEDKRDLLILITPHIVDEGDQVPAPRAPGSP